MNPNSCLKTNLTIAALALAAASAGAAPISVSNHSFEDTGNPLQDWDRTLTNFNVHAIDAGLDPRPDGSAKNAFTNGGSGYQVLGTAVQPNTKYTLTVDVGDRSNTGFNDVSTELRLGVGSTFGDTLLLLTAESRPIPNGGWQTWSATFESGASPPAGNLRIELLGGNQVQFDNVRLDAVASSFAPSSPWEVYIRNHSFEYENSTDFWSGPLGSSAEGGAFDVTPDPDDAGRVATSNGNDGYQVLDTVVLESNTSYTLTVDVGDRTDLGFGGAELRMGTGSTYGTNLLNGTVVSNTIPVNGAAPDDGWETWATTFTAGSGVVGEPLRIELVNPGGVQTVWDNVRLTVTPPVAGVISWTSPSISGITATAATVEADVTEDLDTTILVWDTSDQGTSDTADWAGSNSLGAQSAGTISAPATGLLADTLYTTRYYGANATPDSAWSDPITFSTVLTAAQNPVFTGAVVAAWPGIQLSWQDNASNETGYELYRSTDGVSFSLIASLAPDTTTYTDAPVSQTPATLDPVTYTYRLAAVNASNGSTTDPADCQTTALSTPPAGLILYESFENPDVTGLGGTDPTGWSGGGINDNDSGVLETPFGSQAAWLNSGSFSTTGTILSDVLQDGYTYTLSFNVGRRSDVGGGTYNVSLLAGATTLASTSGSPTQTDFSETDEIVFTPDGSHAALLGETLVIQISGTTQAHFDNVSLTAVSSGGGGGNDFSDWIAGYSVGGQTGLGDDPDGDGVDSGVENFFGTAPDAFTQGLVSGTVSGGTFTFTHPQTGTIADDLTAAYRWSKDLQAFNADGATDGDGTKVDFTVQLNTPEAGTTTVTATVDPGGTATAELFVDVEVTQN